ncbi:hypothetical protein GCM10009551_043180 [Nocardiopsis tropica]
MQRPPPVPSNGGPAPGPVRRPPSTGTPGRAHPQKTPGQAEVLFPGLPRPRTGGVPGPRPDTTTAPGVSTDRPRRSLCPQAHKYRGIH